MSKIFADRLKRGLARLPNPLEFYGYVFCFTTFFAGPAFEIGEYLRSANEAPFVLPAAAATAAAAAGGSGTPVHGVRKDLRWGSRAWAAFSNLALGIVFLGATAYGQANFPFTSVTTPAVLGEWGASNQVTACISSRHASACARIDG